VVIDAMSGGDANVAFEYQDVVLNPTHGMVAVADQPAERGTGAAWTAKGNTWMAGPIAGGRAPFTGVLVQGRPKGGEPFVVALREVDLAGVRAAGASGSR
jgi:hypothetical protein